MRLKIKLYDDFFYHRSASVGPLVLISHFSPTNLKTITIYFKVILFVTHIFLGFIFSL